ncbi:MAG: lysophospholipid acyltransferase family protein [bacterium]
MAKRKLTPLVALYSIFIFYPIGIVITVLCALATILMVPIWGDSRCSYYPGIFWARALMFIALIKINVVGKENFDPKKSYVFMSNHQSMLDIFLIYGWLNSKFKWIMKKELRKMPFVGKACAMMGHIFVDRSSAIKAKQSIQKAKEQLVGGTSIVVFPEGTRTKTGEIGKFKRGAFSIAKDTHIPIIPMTIIGAYECVSSKEFCIKPGKITLVIHPEVNTENITNENFHQLVSDVRDQINSAFQ